MGLSQRFFLVLLAVALAPLLAAGSWFLRSNTRNRENARAFHMQLAIEVHITYNFGTLGNNRMIIGKRHFAFLPPHSHQLSWTNQPNFFSTVAASRPVDRAINSMRSGSNSCGKTNSPSRL